MMTTLRLLLGLNPSKLIEIKAYLKCLNPYQSKYTPSFVKYLALH